MPKELLTQSRFDFRGGLNTAVSPDLLNVNELVRADDVRFVESAGLGAIGKRTGSQQMHASAVASGSGITGLFQWDSPSQTGEVVAVANGKFYHSTSQDIPLSFTEKTPSPAFSTTQRQQFALFRDTTGSANLKLYIADGDVVYQWDGTSLTQLDGSNNIPDAASLLASYHTRMFYNDDDNPKQLTATKVGDATDATTGGAVDGIQALVGQLSGEAITALEVLGSSLLIASPDSIARFSGFSSDDIRLEQDTEGLSQDIGVTGRNAIHRVESFAAILSDVGPYLITESEVRPIGFKVEPEFDGVDRTTLSNASIAFHKGRREIWYLVDGNIYCFNLRLQAWTGPWSYPYTMNVLARYEDSNGDEYIMSGGNDGFVRHMDTGLLDDVDSTGSGGSGYNILVEFAPEFFGQPGLTKSIRRVFVQADAASGDTPELHISADGASFTTYTFDGVSTGEVLNYRVDINEQGGRFRFRFRDGTSTSIVLLHGFTIEAFNYLRPA